MFWLVRLWSGALGLLRVWAEQKVILPRNTGVLSLQGRSNAGQWKCIFSVCTAADRTDRKCLRKKNKPTNHSQLALPSGTLGDFLHQHSFNKFLLTSLMSRLYPKGSCYSLESSNLLDVETCLEQCLAFIQQYLLDCYLHWRGEQTTAMKTTGSLYFLAFSWLILWE